MKIVMAPNAFKGTFSAGQAAHAMEAGALRACPDCEIIHLPVSDGGDGLVEVMADAMGGVVRTEDVRGPLGREVAARFCWLKDQRCAVIEMASASGLVLLQDEERNPLLTSTYGTGQLIQAALDLGAARIVVGIGGSATCDGGAGMASALGFRFIDVNGKSIEPSGGTLFSIARIDSPQKLFDGVAIEAACDVNNPLLGENGAARIYAPQKGATPEQVEVLERGLEVLAARIQQDLGIDVKGVEGGGAAGGLGAGLAAFLGARLRRGADLVLETVGLCAALRDADLAFTGEGRLDDQTLAGKAPGRVAEQCREQSIPCYAITGSVDGDESAMGFTKIYSLDPEGITIEQAAYRAVSDFISYSNG